MDKRVKLKEALWKKAVGYSITESTDEMTSENGQLVLSKQRVSTKEIPPDLSALKMLIDEEGDEFDGMTDDELESERVRLIGLLKKCKTHNVSKM